MRIEFFNVWSGKTGDVLLKYLKGRSPVTDIFCFQEADKNFPNIVEMAIRGFDKYEATKFVSDDDVFSQVTYVKKGLRTEVSWPVLKDIPDVGLGLVTEVATRWGVYTVVNFHGVSRPGDKLDTPKRIEQSRLLIECFKNAKRLIIGGDFNLEIKTRSERMFMDSGFCDLIRVFGIENTRNENIWKKYPDSKQYFSDYVFAKGIQVRKFCVPYNEVSDHLPMIVEIED